MAKKHSTEKQFHRMAGYVRVSTEDQVETKSLEAQRRALRDYAAARGLEIVEIYADEGASAYHDDRRSALSSGDCSPMRSAGASMS